MKRKGFTLIELLAVIVVLAIIALIATPIVMNTIKNAKKGAAERSADNYVKAVEQKVAESRIDGTKIANGDYQIQSDGNLCPLLGCGTDNKDKITIDMSGNKPTSGTVRIANGGVYHPKTLLTVDDYSVGYVDDKATARQSYNGVLCKVAEKKVKSFIWNAKADPLLESSYSAEEIGLLSTEATSKYDNGVTYICNLGDSDDSKNLTFYVLETNGDKVSLILNKNISGSVSWLSAEDFKAAGGVVTDTMKKDNGPCQLGGICATNELGPITAEFALRTNTASWTKLLFNQITLPSKEQIENVSAESLPNFVMGPVYQSIPTDYSTINDAFHGYWTSTPANTYYEAYWVSIEFSTLSMWASPNGPAGIRPVITVSKSNLS